MPASVLVNGDRQGSLLVLLLAAEDIVSYRGGYQADAARELIPALRSVSTGPPWIDRSYKELAAMAVAILEDGLGLLRSSGERTAVPPPSEKRAGIGTTWVAKRE